MKDIDVMMKEAGFTGGRIGEQAPQEAQAPVEETKVENQATETKIEETKDVHTQDDKKEETKQVNEFSLESFNKAIGREFKDVEEVKSILNQSNEYQTLKAQWDEKERLLSEKEKALMEQYDPMSYFADEQQFTINQILKSNKGLNKEVITRLVSTNLTDLKDEDVLKLNELLTTKGKFDEGVVERVINKRYGLNVNKEDLDEEGLKDYEAQRFIMSKDADKAREELSKLLSVEKPAFKDPLLSKQEKEAQMKKEFDETKSKWDLFADNFVKAFDKYTIEYDGDDKQKKTFEYAIDEKFKQVVREKLPLMAAYNKKDVTKQEDVNALVEQIKKDYLWINQHNIIKSAIEDTMSKMTQETFDKYHNPTKIKTDDKPLRESDEERFNKATDEKLMKDFKIKR